MKTRSKPAPWNRSPSQTIDSTRFANGASPRPSVQSAEFLRLRLSIAREGIGLELASPAAFACIRIVGLLVTFGQLRFPVDVSGGVDRFRHRRGELRRLDVEVHARDVEPWAARRLRGLLSVRTPSVWLSVAKGRSTICVSSEAEPDEEDGAESPSLAFDVHCLPDGPDLVFVVANARGVHLPSAPMALAIACVETLMAPYGRRAGAAIVISRPASMLTRSLFPDVGVRAPASDDAVWMQVAALGDRWILQAASSLDAGAPSETALRARRGAELTQEGDDALVEGDAEGARDAYLSALERAPRHPEIVQRVADLDLRTRGREEACLASLSELAPAALSECVALVRGELLASLGDVHGAVASYERAAETELAPQVAARALERAAALLTDPLEACARLDRALARTPRAVSARWRRMARLLELGRLEDALADVGHLEALARGSRAKHAVWARAGRAWQQAGLGHRAAPVFERALRYGPDDALALAGLGQALVEAGSAPRGASLLARALAMATRRRQPTAVVALALARALAEHLDDVPAAIAHVASIDAASAESTVARGLEARWRAAVGDVVGASLAFARLRELAASLPSDVESKSTDQGSSETENAVVGFLVEGADHELRVRGNALAAQRHLSSALRLRPQDPAIRRAHHAAAAEVAGLPRAVLETKGVPSPVATDPVELEVRAELLTRRVQANPSDDAAADELAAILEALGRGHELLALLSARLEDAAPEKRSALLPRVRHALDRLTERAEATGNADEAALFRMAAGSLAG